MEPTGALIPPERIERAILLIRGQRVLLDRDLARLYGVTTKALNQAVRRNLARFPIDFMFRLTLDEAEPMRSQTVTASKRNVRFQPYVFTEQGVSMLSSVLRSQRAVLVNIEIMRAFVRMRQILATHIDLARKLEVLEKKYDNQFKAVFDAIRELMTPPPEPPRGKFGFAGGRRD
jgi:ORF6N domain